MSWFWASRFPYKEEKWKKALTWNFVGIRSQCRPWTKAALMNCKLASSLNAERWTAGLVICQMKVEFDPLPPIFFASWARGSVNQVFWFQEHMLHQIDMVGLLDLSQVSESWWSRIPFTDTYWFSSIVFTINAALKIILYYITWIESFKFCC